MNCCMDIPPGKPLSEPPDTPLAVGAAGLSTAEGLSDVGDAAAELDMDDSVGVALASDA